VGAIARSFWPLANWQCKIRSTEYFGCCHSPHNLGLSQIEIWLRWPFPGHPLGKIKIEIVVSAISAECNRIGKWLTCTTSAANTLLIIETLWWHIAQHHAL
jgi:hypothetical protein